MNFSFEPQLDKTGWDQPGHPPSLIRVCWAHRSFCWFVILQLIFFFFRKIMRECRSLWTNWGIKYLPFFKVWWIGSIPFQLFPFAYFWVEWGCLYFSPSPFFLLLLPLFSSFSPSPFHPSPSPFSPLTILFSPLSHSCFPVSHAPPSEFSLCYLVYFYSVLPSDNSQFALFWKWTYYGKNRKKNEHLKNMLYRNDPKFSDTQNICCNHSKVWTMWLYHTLMSPNDADRMANSVDWVCTVCPGLSVRKFRIITVIIRFQYFSFSLISCIQWW